MKKQQSDNIELYLIITILMVVVIGAMSLPIGNTNDVYVDYTIHQPLTGAPEFTDIYVYAQPSTLIQAPALGAILSSGNVVVLAKTVSKSGRVSVGTIYRTTDSSGTVIIRKVPAAEKEITVELFEDGKYITSKAVTLI